MKEYTENNIRVIEYTYEDWEDGKLINFSKWRPGKELIHKPAIKRKNRDGEDEIIEPAEKWYEYLPYDVWEKINARRKELYWQDINENFEFQKERFLIKYDRSGDKERLLKAEIEKCKRLLLDGIYKEWYEWVIVQCGEREYDIGKNRHAEVTYKFLEWFREFKAL